MMQPKSKKRTGMMGMFMLLHTLGQQNERITTPGSTKQNQTGVLRLPFTSLRTKTKITSTLPTPLRPPPTLDPETVALHVQMWATD